MVKPCDGIMSCLPIFCKKKPGLFRARGGRGPCVPSKNSFFFGFVISGLNKAFRAIYVIFASVIFQLDGLFSAARAGFKFGCFCLRVFFEPICKSPYGTFAVGFYESGMLINEYPGSFFGCYVFLVIFQENPSF